MKTPKQPPASVGELSQAEKRRIRDKEEEELRKLPLSALVEMAERSEADDSAAVPETVNSRLALAATAVDVPSERPRSCQKSAIEESSTESAQTNSLISNSKFVSFDRDENSSDLVKGVSSQAKRVQNYNRAKIEISAMSESSNNATYVPLRPDVRRRRRWSAEEEAALISGFGKNGTRWSKTLEENSRLFRHRNIHDLKAKHNLITKKTSYYTAQKRRWALLDGGGGIKKDALGQEMVVVNKFPEDAAIRFAKRSAHTTESERIIRVADVSNIVDVFRYQLTYEGGRPKVKRIRKGR